MSKHSKGQWEILPWNNGHRIFAEDRYVGFIGNSDNPGNEDEANARLIASAPELKQENEKLKKQNKEMYELLKDVDSIGGEVWMKQRETLLSQIDEEA